MKGMNITSGLSTAFRKNCLHYLQEALGLGIFMASACYFGAMLYAPQSPWYYLVPGSLYRDLYMGIAMGCTALLIFYLPLTATSGAHINPAVTLAFVKLGRMNRYDALFYILFQFAGAIAAVQLMQWYLGTVLTGAPVNTVVTIPGKPGIAWAAITELLISFLTMSMVLFTASGKRLKKYTRLFAAILVCTWVVVAGPVSGFSMNPARTFASAWAANTWTAWWIYLLFPVAGMLLAAECYVQVQRARQGSPSVTQVQRRKKKISEPLEFVL